MYEVIFLIIAYAVPMYVANATPILFHGKKPLDFGKKIKGKRIFGKGKSILGTLNGILFGSLAGLLFAFLFPQIFYLIPNYLLLVVLLAIGAMLGDIIESFLKRRAGFESGERCFLFDQIDFILGGFFLSLLIRIPEFEVVIVLLFVTIFMHIITNFCAFKLKLKKVPW